MSDTQRLLSNPELNLLDVLFNQMPIGIAILDRDFRLRHWNPTLREFVRRHANLPPDQVAPGVSFLDLVPGSESTAGEILRRALAGETVRCEALLLEINGVRSYWDSVSAPLRQGDEIAGIVHVASDATERVLASRQLEATLVDLQRTRAALQAANHLLEHRVAVGDQELARRNAELEQRRQGAESLHQVLALINSNRPLADVLETISRQAGILMGRETGVAIYQYNSDRERLELRTSHRLPTGLQQIASLPVAALAGETFKLRLPLVVANVRHYIGQMRRELAPLAPEVQAAFDALEAAYHSYLAVPLVVRDMLYGSIAFHFTEERDLDEADITLALTLSEQAALAIDNARLHTLEQERLHIAESLRDILAMLNSAAPLQSTFETILFQAQRLLGADAAVIYRVNQPAQQIQRVAVLGFPPALLEPDRFPIAPTGATRATLDRQPYMMPDIAEAYAQAEYHRHPLTPELQPWLHCMAHTFKTLFSVPLLVGDELYGDITLYYTQHRSFSQDEREMALTFGAQAALAIENARLREHAGQVAVMAERNRLARELHDAVTQTLFSASLIADVLPRIWQRNPEVGQAKLAELRELTRGALAEMRTLLLELRPASLIETNLDDLLRQLAAAAIGRSRLKVAVHVNEPQPLTPEVQVALYRIAQEALNNVVKHAAASRVDMTLHFGPGLVELTIADNGRGFDESAIGPHTLGLGIMRERVSKIGADLQVESVIGAGTTIRVRVG
ncbi:MAG: GAF domain-containing protein [Oscillochloris sp.]|nr:GAF domain-containing protein [Oscillochloris sp.]